MKTNRFSRRQMLAVTGASLALGLASRTAQAKAAPISFEELYGKIGVLGMSFSDKVKQLAGKPVAMKGFMAPPIKAEADFFVLTAIPMALCPFCSSDADWPADIVVVYLDKAQTFEQANRQIELKGKLEVGSWTDPNTGFVSLLRIVGAEYGVA